MTKALSNKIKLNGDIVCPEQYGAVGDGVTDDRAALKAALESGHIVDGNGKTYAISGTCQPTSIAGLQNITLLQIADTSVANYILLYIKDLSDFFVRNANFNTGSNITTLYSDDGNSGITIFGTNDGVTENIIGNFLVENVTVTGNGCGAGIHIRHATQFVVDGCRVFDRVSGSSPDPTNDSQNGIDIINCSSFTISNCHVHNLRTRLSGTPTLKWTRGFLFAEIRDCVIDSCISSEVDQGFDFSGSYEVSLSYTGSRDWVISNCVAHDCGTYGFKFANVTRDGLVSGCSANRIGTIGFVFSPSSVALPIGLEYYNTQNIKVVGCVARNILGNGWSGSNAEGFRVMNNPTYTTYPRNIQLHSCSVEDTQQTPTTLVAYNSDVLIPEYPTAGYDQPVANTITNCTNSNNIPTQLGPFMGIDSCTVTSSALQSISSGTYQAVDWNVDLDDHTRLHSTSSNNNIIYIKTPGYYRINAQVRFAANASGGRYMRLKKGASVIDRTTVTAVPHASIDTTLHTSIITYCVSGSELSVEVMQNSGGALNLQSTEGYLSVEKI